MLAPPVGTLPPPAGVLAPPAGVAAPPAGARKAVNPAASATAMRWRNAALDSFAASLALRMLPHSMKTFGTVDRLSPPRSVRPSAWIEIAASACARLPIAARWVTHGPTPWLLVRVRTTVAPSARSRRASLIATLKVKAASVYPASVSVPVVSHGFISVITLTSWLMTAGCAQLSPLCPGSITTTWPASGRLGAVAVAEGVLAGESEVTGTAAGTLGDVGAGAPEQAASRPARVPAAAKAAARGALPRARGRQEALPARPHTQLTATFLTR